MRQAREDFSLIVRSSHPSRSNWHRHVQAFRSRDAGCELFDNPAIEAGPLVKVSYASLNATPDVRARDRVQLSLAGLPVVDEFTVVLVRSGGINPQQLPDRLVEQLVPGLVVGDPPGVVVDADIAGRVVTGDLWVYGITKTDGVDVRVLTAPVDVAGRGFDSLVRHYGEVQHDYGTDSPYHPAGIHFSEFADVSVLHSWRPIDPSDIVEAALSPGRQFTRAPAELAERWWHRDDKYVNGQPRRVPDIEVPPLPEAWLPSNSILLGDRAAHGPDSLRWLSGEENSLADAAAGHDRSWWTMSWNPDDEILRAAHRESSTSLSLGRYGRHKIDEVFPAEHRFERVSEDIAGDFDDLLERLDRLPFAAEPNAFSEYRPVRRPALEVDQELDDGFDIG